VISHNWYNWLSGRIGQDEEYINSYEDKNGILIATRQRQGIKSLILLSAINKRIKKRLILGADDQVVAEMSYNYQQPTECSLPTALTIKKLPYNMSITLNMSHAMPVDFTHKSFKLTIPPHFQAIK
jgi:hypothetical protein